MEGLAFKVDAEYVIKVKFNVKKYSPFGSYPKFMGIKLTENFTDADPNTRQAYKVLRHSSWGDYPLKQQDLKIISVCTMKIFL